MSQETNNRQLRMPAFWERKMKTYFMRFDFDHDGVITEKDFELLAIRFAECNHAYPGGKEKLVKGLREWWKKWTAVAKGEEKRHLTIPVFIESVKNQLHDPEEFKKIAGFVIGNALALMEVKQDGYLQKEEFRGYFEAAGLTDLEFTEVAFPAIDLDHDGKLSFDDFINAYFEFMFSEDEKNPNNLFFGSLL